MIIGRGSLHSLFGFAAAILISAGCATAPTEYKTPVPLAAADRTVLNTRVFAAAWSLVNEKYYDAKFQSVDWPAMRVKYGPAAAAAADDEALYRVLNQMVGELRDKHVYAFLPRLVHEGRATHRPDTGLRQQRVEDRWIVTNVVSGSPAEAVGIKRGWLVVSRNERPPADEPLLDALSTRVGEPINYTFIDQHDHPRSLSVVPQLVPFDSTRFISHDVPGGIRYLRFDAFHLEAIRWLNREIEAHGDAPGIVIDLRYNAGGSEPALRRAVRVFFPHRQRIGQTVSRTGEPRNMDSFTMFSTLYSGKVVILTSAATASSAEIFSHAMRFHKRAIVIGQQTMGSVVGAVRHRLPGGGALTVPDIDFLGLDGRRLEGVGIAPDIVVPLVLADLRAGRDAGLDVALSWLRDNIAEN